MQNLMLKTLHCENISVGVKSDFWAPIISCQKFATLCQKNCYFLPRLLFLTCNVASFGSCSMLISWHLLLQLVLCRSDVRYACTAKADVTDVKYGILSDGNRSFWTFQFYFQTAGVCRTQQQTTPHQRIAVLAAKLAVKWNPRVQVGWTAVDPVWRTGGQVARV